MKTKKKVIIYGQQKATRKSNKHVVKFHARLRMQKKSKELYEWDSFCTVLTCGVIYVSKEAIYEIS